MFMHAFTGLDFMAVIPTDLATNTVKLTSTKIIFMECT